MDELAQLTDDNGHCVVENFAVGREGYGNVFFEGITDVTGLNLDDIGIYKFGDVLFKCIATSFVWENVQKASNKSWISIKIVSPLPQYVRKLYLCCDK